MIPNMIMLIMVTVLTACAHPHPHPQHEHRITTHQNRVYSEHVEDFLDDPNNNPDSSDETEYQESSQDPAAQQSINSYLKAQRSALQGDRSQAYLQFEQHHQRWPNAHSALKILHHYEPQHDQNHLRAAHKAALLYPDDPPILIYYARLLLAAGQPEKAKKHLLAAQAADPHHPDVYTALIEIELNENPPSQAIRLAQQLAELEGQKQSALIFQLRAHLKQAEFHKAQAIANQITADYSDEPVSLALMAYGYVIQKKPLKAAEILSTLHENHHNRADLIKIYEMIHSHSEVIQTFEQIVSLKSHASAQRILVTELGWLYYTQSQWSDLQAMIYRYADQHPLNGTLKWLLAVATESSDPSKALQIYTDITQDPIFGTSAAIRIFEILKNPYLTPTPYMLDRLLADQPLATAAQNLANLNSPTLISISLAGLYYFQLGDLTRAQQILKQGSQRFPNSNILLVLSYTYYEIGQTGRAESILQDLYKKHPFHPLILNALGYTMAIQNKNLDQAEQLISLADQLEPNQAAYLDSLGWVYFLTKRLKQAQTTLKKASKLDPFDAEIHEHLARLYQALGDCVKALYHLDQSMQWVNTVPHQNQLQQTIHLLHHSCPQPL